MPAMERFVFFPDGFQRVILRRKGSRKHYFVTSTFIMCRPAGSLRSRRLAVERHTRHV